MIAEKQKNPRITDIPITSHIVIKRFSSLLKDFCIQFSSLCDALYRRIVNKSIRENVKSAAGRESSYSLFAFAVLTEEMRIFLTSTHFSRIFLFE